MRAKRRHEGGVPGEAEEAGRQDYHPSSQVRQVLIDPLCLELTTKKSITILLHRFAQSRMGHFWVSLLCICALATPT